MSQQTSILSAATLIGGLSVVSAVLGIVYKRVLVSVFVGDQRPLIDAFFAAFRVPDLLFQLLVVGVLSATFIPVYSRLIQKESDEQETLVNTLITIVSAGYIALSVVVSIFAVPIIRTFTGVQFSDDQVQLSASLMRIMLFAQFFFLLSNFLSGILQSHRSFLLPALSPVLYNVGIIIGTIFLSPFFGIYGPCIGVLIGALLHFGVQLPLALRYGLRYQPMWSIQNLHVREVLRLMGPRGATQSTNAVEDFVSVYIATSFGTTLLTSITYASSLVAAPVRFFGVSIAQAALPFLSAQAKESDVQGFVQLLTKTLHQIAFFMFPAAVLLLVLRIPIVRLAFGSREFPWSETVLLGRLVALYSISVGATAMIHVLLRAFYAIKETRLPFFIALFSMGINVTVMWVGAYALGLGVYAIPIGFTIAALSEVLLLIITLYHKIGVFFWKEFFLPQGKILLASASMAISLYIPMKLLDQLVFDTTRVSGLLALTGVASSCGLIAFLGFCKLFSVEQLSILASIHGRLRDWKNKLVPTQEVLGVQDDV